MRKLTLPCLILVALYPCVAAAQSNDPHQKFQLFGTARDDIDPDNSSNELISIDATPTQIGVAFRNLKVKIAELDHMLNFKYFFPARSCGGGSPRVQLFVDADGNGKFEQLPAGPDFVLHGHVNPPSTLLCPATFWRFEDLTDEGNRWEATPPVSGLPNTFPLYTWDFVETVVTAGFPAHEIMSGMLLDGESCTFGFLAACGKAYYDLLTIGNRTIENHQDTAQNPN